MNQLTMDLSTPPSYRRDDFVVSGSNHAAYDMVMAWPQWSTHAMWLWGAKSSGKTHLAQIWKQQADAAECYGRLPAHSADAYGGARALLIDDLQLGGQEEALFHLLNYTKEKGYSLLLVDSKPAAGREVALPDLASRLRALPVARIAEPDDMLLQAVMVKQLADKQLRVPPEVVQYLMRRIDRSFAAVERLVETLDQRALADGRSITLPFIKEILTNS